MIDEEVQTSKADIKEEYRNDSVVTKPKRIKTTRACTHCHKAHMTCDPGRPCKKCIKRKLASTCQDAPRKRKKYLEDVPNSSLLVRRVNSHDANYSSDTQTPLTTSFPNQSQQAHLPTLQAQTLPQNRIAQFEPQRLLHSTASQVPNHITYEATLFQHSSTSPELAQPSHNGYSLPDIYVSRSVPPNMPPPRQTEIHHPHQPQPQPQPQPQSQYSPVPGNSSNSNAQLYMNYSKKTKFLSTAADLEYSTLSNILQDAMGGHHTTSNEGTPNSNKFSPVLSPPNAPSTVVGGTSQHQLLSSSEASEARKDETHDTGQAKMHTPSPSDFARTSLFDKSTFPICDESINQYFIGHTGTDHQITYFPDVIAYIEQMKSNDYAVYKEKNSKSLLSFSITGSTEQTTHQHGTSGGTTTTTTTNDTTTPTLFKEPEEIYAKVQMPFSYTPGYHSLIAYLRKRFSKPMLVKMAQSMAVYRPSFIACTNSLKEHDLIFMEQCFQRTLLTYHNFIKISGTPTIVWRRTGEIAYVGDEFCILTGWTKEELLGSGNNGKKRFIVELLDDESVIEYFQVFSRIAFGDFLGATITECTLLTPKRDVKIRTGCIGFQVCRSSTMAITMAFSTPSSKLTSSLITSVSIVCLGSLQFGYHMAELNSPELVLSCRRSQPGSVPYEESFFGSRGFKQCIPMSPDQIGLVTSIFSIGGLIGSFYVGYVADKYGRKITSYLHCALYILGSLLNGLSNEYVTLLIGRFICGLGAGMALVITALYINEVAPTDSKGLLGSMNQVSINVGILFTQMLSLKWSNDNDWRWLLITAAIVAMINVLVLIFYVYESPLWLANQGNRDQAFTVLHKLRAGSYSQVTEEVNSWKDGHDESPGTSSVVESSDIEDNPFGQAQAQSQQQQQQKATVVSLKEYITSPEFKNSRIASTGVLVLQQFDGINSIIFYGVSVLISIFPNHSILINCLISLVNVVVTFASANVVDRLGRKPLLLTSVSFLGIATILIGLGIIWTNSVLSIVGTFTYITFFAIGLGPIPFLLVGEVTQTRAKATAQSFGVSLNWVATFIVGYSFPVLLHSIGGSVYFIFTAMCIFSVWFIKNYVPETKGLSTYAEVWERPHP
ncbi:hypothetical protein KGF56_002352 [Candida oxycetoniae]|uniref:Major facilitator superfamily (MFS) profile domain-containing protein n=1 Tax=Candida oxycetoniae TaxID=497107 RepID=A0AAI9WYH5_9ASCO|nr:uncharacterized protein KGF56_002352 [Candida oxycetoniae]KAI3404835.2 hypothetical protein KGF56_002352 [Candida oxycetoniae]